MKSKIFDSKEAFELVYDLDALNEVLLFLKKGFKWSNEYSEKVKKVLSFVDKGTPIAALNKSSGKISIAILLFHQGVIETERDNKNIINFSAWYAIPSKRGIYAINFARKLVKNLDKFILTNYTPSPEVCKIFKNIGFVEMPVNKKTIGLVKSFPFFSFSSLIKLLSIGVISSSVSFFKAFKTKIRHISSIADVHIQDSSLVFYSTQIIRKFKFRIKVLNIYTMSKTPGILTLAQLALLALKHRTLSINIFYIVNKGEVSKANWLIYPRSTQDKVVAPVGSEISLYNT